MELLEQIAGWDDLSTHEHGLIIAQIVTLLVKLYEHIDDTKEETE